MKRVYESFSELAREMTNSGGALHAYNCVVSNDPFINDACISWQRGVEDFAEWLDYIGVKVNIIDDTNNFYNFMSKKAKKCLIKRRKLEAL